MPLTAGQVDVARRRRRAGRQRELHARRARAPELAELLHVAPLHRRPRAAAARGGDERAGQPPGRRADGCRGRPSAVGCSAGRPARARTATASPARSGCAGDRPAARARPRGGGHGRHRQAGHANALLWPLTWGYFFEHLQPGVLGEKARESCARTRSDHVRGRGPLPLLQIADQPYGVLPVTSLTRIAPGDALERGAGRPAALAARSSVASGRGGAGPAARPGGEPRSRADAHGGARQRGRSLGLRSREAFGGEYALEPVELPRRRAGRPRRMAGADRPRAGARDRARRARRRVADGAFAAAAAPVALPPAGDARGRGRLPARARLARPARRAPPAASVLALLLRHAALRSYADAAAPLLGVAPEQRADAELIAVTAPQDTVWDRLQRPLADGRKVGDVLDARRKAPGSGPAAFDGFWAALAALSKLDGGGWEDLLAETLDTCSHRLDAWVTSLAARRLARMRAARGGGLAVGAYGWVTDLRPSEARHLAAEERRAVAARDAAAAALEAARPRSIAAVAARVARDAELTGAQATLGAATARVEQLQQQIAALEERLAGLDEMEPGPKPRPNPAAVALRGRIARANAALEHRCARRDIGHRGGRHGDGGGRSGAARGDGGEPRRSPPPRGPSTPPRTSSPRCASASGWPRPGPRSSSTPRRSSTRRPPPSCAARTLPRRALATGPGAAEAPFAVDLSSARLRRALHVLEGVRAGQPPAALLGYQLERDLRERRLCPPRAAAADAVALRRADRRGSAGGRVAPERGRRRLDLPGSCATSRPPPRRPRRSTGEPLPLGRGDALARRWRRTTRAHRGSVALEGLQKTARRPGQPWRPTNRPPRSRKPSKPSRTSVVDGAGDARRSATAERPRGCRPSSPTRSRPPQALGCRDRRAQRAARTRTRRSRTPADDPARSGGRGGRREQRRRRPRASAALPRRPRPRHVGRHDAAARRARPGLPARGVRRERRS